LVEQLFTFFQEKYALVNTDNYSHELKELKELKDWLRKKVVNADFKNKAYLFTGITVPAAGNTGFLLQCETSRDYWLQKKLVFSIHVRKDGL